MTFKEWFNSRKHGSCSDPYETMKKGWDAAIDEAATIAREGAFYTATGTADHIASKIKELKG